MNLTILICVFLIGITNCSDGHSTSVKCVNILSHTSGRMQCEPNENIHIETMSIDNNKCPSIPSSTSREVSSITTLKCQNIGNCNVPFISATGFSDYLNIQYKCLGCKSATNGTLIQIVCKGNTRISIQDVWIDGSTACPAYKTTHKKSVSYIHTQCNLKQTCKVPNIEFQMMSIYYNCEVLKTTNRMRTITTTTTSVNSKTAKPFISETTFVHSTIVSSAIPSNTSYNFSTRIGNTVEDRGEGTFPAGAVAGGVVAGLIILVLPVAVLLYRHRNNDHTKSARKQFVTRSNPAYESDIDVRTDVNPPKNKDSSLYHHYFEVQNDQDIVTPTHNYINTDTMTYDYASENGSLKDDTYDNMKQQSERIDSNTYSHLQDTFNDSDENTYNHTIHDRVPDTSENNYSVSRGQMSNDDYDVSGNHNRANQIIGSENVYN